MFSDQLEILVVELPKLLKLNRKPLTKLEQWGYFFFKAEEVDMSALYEGLTVPEIEKALSELVRMNGTPEERMKYIDRVRTLREMLRWEKENAEMVEFKANMEQEKAAIEKAKAELDQFSASVEHAQAELEQFKASVEQSKAELEQSRASLEQSEMIAERAKAELEAEKAKLELEKAELEFEKARLAALKASLER